MKEKLRRRLSDFKWKDCLTKIKINDAIINTITEINSLHDCGVIAMEEYIRIGQELWGG